jgi:beta-lactamase class A
MKRWRERGLFLVFLLAIGLVGALSRSVPEATPWRRPLAALGRDLWVQSWLVQRYLHPAEPRLPAGFAAAGLPVGGLTVDEAWAQVEQQRLAPLRQPVTLSLNGETILLDASEAVLHVDTAPIRERMAELVRDWPPLHKGIYLGSAWEPTTRVNENVPLLLEVDEEALRAKLEPLAERYRLDPVPLTTTTIVTSATLAAAGLDPYWMGQQPVAAFVSPVAGWQLDVESALVAVSAALVHQPREPVSLTLQPVSPPEPDPALLEAVLRGQLERIPATVGIFVHDLQSGREVAVHAGTIFSGASVIKIAILVQVYRTLDESPGAQVTRDLEYMMIYSDNAAANRLMAVGGEGDAPRGLERMTAMLRRLELPDSFLCNTYDGGPRWEGCPPKARPVPSGELKTDADKVLQTTPRDMGRLLVYLYECSAGGGPLLEQFPGEITVAECQDMIALMQRNDDVSRLVSGVPDVPVAHKSGWIDDMKADAGIVFSPGGDYVVSIFVWQADGLSEYESSRWIARLSWIVYSYFNPL